VINISNFTSKDNTPRLPVQPARTMAAAGPPARTAAATGPPARTAASDRSFRAGLGRILVLGGQALLSWLGAVPQRLGDRLFAMNDTEAYWRGWQITKARGGLARSYRDPRFDTLAECARCRGTGVDGAGVTTEVPCVPCLGTGRIALGEVS